MRNTPWITDGSFEYLERWITANAPVSVFEYGAGGSTVWFDRHPGVASVVSVEHRTEWFDNVRREGLVKTKLLLRELPYHESIRSLRAKVDLVMIDGRGRVECFFESLDCIRRGGIIVFDNMERARYATVVSVWKAMGFVEPIKFRQQGPDRNGFKMDPWETWVFEFKKD